MSYFSQKTYTFGEFKTNSIYLVSPVEFIVNKSSKIFGVVNFLQFFTINIDVCVIGINGSMSVTEYQKLRFAYIKA